MFCKTSKNFIIANIVAQCLIACAYATSNEIFFEHDKSYQVVDIKVPEALWKHAFQPTPVLRSPVTVVVPIHVTPDEDTNVIEDAEDAVTDVNIEDNLTTENSQVINDENLGVAQNPVDDPTNTTSPQQVSGSLIRFPCSCIDGQCGCCTGAILERFQTKACGNISFIPEDFIFDVKLSINNNTVVRRRVSASDPPPICFNPRRAPFVQVCAEISNIRIRNRNAFACLDINADIAGFPIYSASFRCFGLGTSGVQTGLKPKPVSSGPATVSLFGNNENDDDDDGGLLDDPVFGGGDGFLGSDGADSDGPLDAIGDVVGDFFGDGRKYS